jgi:1-acyl-sn-glycerol-3-phosphate acyltransferase
MDSTRVIRRINQLLLLLFTHMTVTGQENIPQAGPLIIVANHRSTIDPSVLSATMPPGTRFVGPGDFKLLFPANLFIRWNKTITVRRSTQMERSALKQMTEVLNDKQMLALFPEGGTWEKPIDEAKPGAAYLSLVTGAPILPIGLGNTYQIWPKVMRLARPALQVRIGHVLPPVTASNRSQRTEALQAATHLMMQRIYDLLPMADRQWYDDQARRRFDLLIEVWRGEKRTAVTLTGQAILAEIMLKPNLISPLAKNARLMIDPLLYPGQKFAVAVLQKSIHQLQAAFSGPLDGYLEYRLGEAATRQLFAFLQSLAALIREPQVTHVALTPHVTML